MYVSTPVGVSVCLDWVYHACSIMFVGFKTLVDLDILDIEEFDNILDMSWLFPYYVFLIVMPKLIE